MARTESADIRRASAPGRAGIRAVGLVLLAGMIAVALFGPRPLAVMSEGELDVQIHTVDDSGASPIAIVTILDPAGRPIIGLQPDQLRVEESGSAARVLDVTRVVNSDIHLGVVLAIDSSGSMAGPGLESARESARAFLAALPRGDQAAVLVFSSDVRLVEGMTADIAALNSAVEGIEAGGGTALYDAVIESVHAAVSAESTRKAVILLSDGHDFEGSSRASREEALAEAAAAGVPVYAIGFGDSIDEAFLAALAERTRGRYFVTLSGEDLVAAYEELGGLLRSQYVVTFERSAPPEQREITVVLTAESEQGTGVAEFSYTRAAVPLPAPTATAPEATAGPIEVASPVATALPLAQQSEASALPLWPIVAVSVLAGVAAVLLLRRRRRGPRSLRTGGAILGLDVPPPPRHEPVTQEASLTLLTGADAGKVFAVREEIVTLGRDPTCTIELPAQQEEIAIEQARVWWRDEKLMFHDISRAQSSLISGKALSWATLDSGDVIEIGVHRLRVDIGNGATDGAAPAHPDGLPA